MIVAYWLGSVAMAVKAWFFAAARTRLGPPISTFSIASAVLTPGRAIVSEKGYKLTTTRSINHLLRRIGSAAHAKCRRQAHAQGVRSLWRNEYSKMEWLPPPKTPDPFRFAAVSLLPWQRPWCTAEGASGQGRAGSRRSAAR